MRYSKSILIFLFVSSTTSAFYYALKRTNRNISKSIMFTMYFLAIKIGLIGPIITDRFEPPQLNPRRVVETRVLPCYTASDGYYARPPRVYMGETKMGTLAPHYSRSASPIAELRAGSRSEDLKQTAYVLVSIWYALKLQQSYGFKPLPNQVQMPHLEAANNLLFGKPKINKFYSQNRFPTALEGRKRYRAEVKIDMNDQYQKFLLTKNPNTNCSKQRYKKLCVDPKTGMIDKQSIDEAEGLLEAEGLGLVIGGYRTGKDKIDADFGIEGPPPYDLADVKTPINWGKGNENLTVAAKRMGKKIVKQKERMQSYGKMPLHIVDLKKLDAHEKQDYKVTVINEIGNSKDIVFINDSNNN